MISNEFWFLPYVGGGMYAASQELEGGSSAKNLLLGAALGVLVWGIFIGPSE